MREGGGGGGNNPILISGIMRVVDSVSFGFMAQGMFRIMSSTTVGLEYGGFL